MPTCELSALKDIYIPLASSVIALAAVFLAFLSLVYSRRDRQEAREYLREQEAAAKTSLRRKHQEEIFAALQGGKETVGFMALQLSRDPEQVSPDNVDSILSALCLAYIFNSSSRARALSLKALKVFSEKDSVSETISEILRKLRTSPSIQV